MTSRKSMSCKPSNIFESKNTHDEHEVLSINLKLLYLALTLYFKGKFKPHFLSEGNLFGN